VNDKVCSVNNHETMKNNMPHIIISSEHHLTIQEVDLLSRREMSLTLSADKQFRENIKKGADFVSEKLRLEGSIYGVTTGYGNDVTRIVPLDIVDELPLHLMRFHGCGLGEFLSIPQTRAVLAIRLASLCRSASGVTVALLEMLERLIQHDILPVIPSEGSVGASGDLTPLSYVAASIVGERDVWYQGKKYPTAEVFKKLGIQPHKLRPKEALAIMNGTTVMTALAVEAYCRAEYLVRLSSRLTAMTSLALKGNPEHFDPFIFSAKPHPGQASVAAYIRADLEKAPTKIERLQDRYSTRCAPHVIGVLADMLPVFKTIIETEINSANDNPLIDVSDASKSGRVLHGGNFYGGHIAFVMDSLKNLVANIADLLDRQMATLVDSKFNQGLPSNLSGIEGPRAAINHGLKALQIGASAWAAEALKNTLPASVFSRSTESHNQDKVSMGTIAARDALRVLQLTEQVATAQLFAALQALRLREREGVLSRENYSADLCVFIDAISESIPFVIEDQPLDTYLRDVIDKIQQRCWDLYQCK
jgi:histidine ammonia-lyase